jgi:hypothetical protein
MKRYRVAPRFVIATVAASLVGSVAARVIGWPKLVVPLGMPAVLLTGWAFVGHLVTLDDDAPGGWSNPERSSELWRQSLLNLGILLAVLCGTCCVVLV